MENNKREATRRTAAQGLCRLFSALLTTLAVGVGAVRAQVSPDVMRHIYEQVQTPHKYGLVVVPQDHRHQCDCPTVFRHQGRWYMTYVCYDGQGGTDGRGYETLMAVSDDLLHWQPLSTLLALPADSLPRWDQNQRGGFPSLIDMDWGGSYELQSFKGRHWMTYIGGPGRGYEAVNHPLSIGQASTPAPLTPLLPWETANEPLLSYDDNDAQWWEQLTQYKSTVYWLKEKARRPAALRKFPFVMFYNAGGKDAGHPKGERIGIALSKDMKRWQRYGGNPVFAHDTDGTITGDAQIVRMALPPHLAEGADAPGEVYVMFYFSAFNPLRPYNAYNTFAASHDLTHWTDWDGPDLIVPSKPYDDQFAHKSCVVNDGGTVYHFYCAVNSHGQRGIAVATSRHLGKSEVTFPAPPPTGHRHVQQLGEGWTVTLLSHENADARTISPAPGERVSGLSLPINLDDYYGTQQGEHGNLHGQALFENTFRVPRLDGKTWFIRFEGVGTYATVTLNGHRLGWKDAVENLENLEALDNLESLESLENLENLGNLENKNSRLPIGRTTLTLNISPYLNIGGDNHLQVLVDHPAGITDMPWVCGGCSTEWGFSEGSQPFGIFRPVVVEATDAVRVEPFGVHVWNNDRCDSIFVETEVKNYGNLTEKLQIVSKVTDKSGRQVVRLTDDIDIMAGQTLVVRQRSAMADAQLWSTETPYLYHLGTIIKRNGKAVESTDTPFGLSAPSWPLSRHDGNNTFMLNGHPVFINGVCEYEHALGHSHAFTEEQIAARVKMVSDAGFNAFRDAHQPHHLRYGQLFDEQGILWWPQFSAHIWYDTPEFRRSFKRHLVQWVKERRNSPSIILWGLQNESTLPADFAAECCDIIRRLDPRCGTQRLITTCNGGEGTDWNVVQNWSGTYGGDIDNYARELMQPDQLLNGEYGAWRTLGNHTGEGYTEEQFCQILGKKAALAESVADSVCGHFLWLLMSHDNPGRRQPDEALRTIDKVGPFNYKGLFTPWEQPTDAFYMYQQRHNPQPIAPATAHIDEQVLRPEKGWQYVFRLNCGGDDYTDQFGNTWMQDNQAWSHSWGERFGKPFLASQTYNDSLSSELFRSSRFGRHELRFHFPVPAGRYRVEFYFVEPWYRQADAEGLRIFDVSVNDSTVIRDLDIWAQAHYGQPYKRTADVTATGDGITVTFPKVKAGQAAIAAIAVARQEDAVFTAPSHSPQRLSPTFWHDMQRDILVKTPDSLLPPKQEKAMEVEGKMVRNRMEWQFTVGVAKVYALRWKYYNPEKSRQLRVTITDSRGVVYKNDLITFLQTQQKKTKRKATSITTGTQINAGTYRVTVSGDGFNQMIFDPLSIE